MELVASARERVSLAGEAPTKEAAERLQAFGYELIRDNPQMVQAGNLVLSPASIGAAFAMARAGARGETAEQIDAVLHFPKHRLGDAYNSLTADWSSRSDTSDAPELSMANSAFVLRGVELRADYLDALATDFEAGVRTVDFPQRAGGRGDQRVGEAGDPRPHRQALHRARPRHPVGAGQRRLPQGDLGGTGSRRSGPHSSRSTAPTALSCERR